MRLAAAFTDINVEFVDAVDGDTVAVKAIPMGPNKEFSKGVKGCWRSHMNALSR
jgi:hypothetical protein